MCEMILSCARFTKFTSSRMSENLAMASDLKVLQINLRFGIDLLRFGVQARLLVYDSGKPEMILNADPGRRVLRQGPHFTGAALRARRLVVELRKIQKP